MWRVPPIQTQRYPGQLTYVLGPIGMHRYATGVLQLDRPSGCVVFPFVLLKCVTDPKIRNVVPNTVYI